jgi:hypothetical protein
LGFFAGLEALRSLRSNNKDKNNGKDQSRSLRDDKQEGQQQERTAAAICNSNSKYNTNGKSSRRSFDL